MLLLLENPESYVIHKTHSGPDAVVVDNATLSWTGPVHPPASGDGYDQVSKEGHAEVLPTLRSICFTLQKVNSDFNLINIRLYL